MFIDEWFECMKKKVKNLQGVNQLKKHHREFSLKDKLSKKWNFSNDQKIIMKTWKKKCVI